ncbi:Rho-GTPase-activating protein 8 [Microbotryomycetes sp. JL201]|nr:Rho-GTPase-activating protein 8 [Microbotryomycetes sp. JL201]
MSEPARARAGSVATPATVTLPLSFSNSFWSHDYRTGVQRLYSSLDSGIVASQEVIDHVRRRAAAERSFARALAPHALDPGGLGHNDASGVRASFEAVASAQATEARARAQLADDLVRSIADPFEQWSQAHEGRIRSSRAFVETHLAAWEKAHSAIHKHKSHYDDACRALDQIEDETSYLKGTSPTPPTETAQSSRSTELTTSVDHKSSDSQTHSENKTETQPQQQPEPGDSGDNVPVSKQQSNYTPAKKQDDERSEDGGNVENDDDDTIIPRSGLVGGASAITSALGRAFTVRRNPGPGRARADSIDKAQAQQHPPTSPDMTAAIDWSRAKLNNLFERVAGPQTGQDRLERARRSVEDAEDRLKSAVLALDNLRLVLEEAIHEHLAYTQRCEVDRVKAISSVMRSFHVAISALPKLVSQSLERINATLELSNPLKDIIAIIERDRTGPFAPKPIVFQPHWSEPYVQRFGIDLRKFAETTEAPTFVPPVLSFLMEHIVTSYSKVSDTEKRKIWLYETPLGAQHHLRQALNSTTTKLDSAKLTQYDLPVVASTVKLWLLELEVPPIIFTQYDEIKQLYPVRVGSEIVEVPAKAIAEHLSRLPPIHLEVLRYVMRHFHELLNSTKTDEADEVYLQKLSLSLARCVLRPRYETAITLDDRFPALLFSDLVRQFEVIFSSADELKSERTDRFKPRRQRTRPTDARLSRSSMGVAATEVIHPDKADSLLREQRQALASPPTKVQTTAAEPLVSKDLSRTGAVTGDPGSAEAIESPKDAMSPPAAPHPPLVPDPRPTLDPSASPAGSARGARGPRPTATS